MIEEWRPIPSVPGYEASDLGRVRRSTPGPSTRVGRVKKGSKTNCGYLLIGCFEEGRRVNVFVHRAIAETFIGPLGDLQVNHLDGDKTNNIVGNLQLVTAAENMAHAKENGLVASGDRWHTPKTAARILRMSGDGHWTRGKPDRLARGENNGSVKHPERLHRGEQQHNAKLTPSKVIAIRSLSSGGASFEEIAKLYGVTRQNIRFIVNRVSWKHIP